MKKTLLFLCILTCFTSYSQTTVNFNGIGPFRIGMNLAQVEKIVKGKFTLQHIGIDGGFTDTFSIDFKGKEMTFYFNEADSVSVAELGAISSTDPVYKTAGMLGVNSEKIRIINAFPSYRKFIAPEFTVYPERSADRSHVAIMHSEMMRAIVFRLLNNKTIAIEVSRYYEPQ